LFGDMMLEKACGGLVCGGRGGARSLGRAGQRGGGDPRSTPGPQGLNDSKKLSPKQREALEPEIWPKAVAYAVASPRWSRSPSSTSCTHRPGHAPAVEPLSVAPAFALVDGNYLFPLPCAVKTWSGRLLSCSIAAASILAKVAPTADAADGRPLPGYGFAFAQGLHAAIHVDACAPSALPEHRMSWAPVRLAMEGRPAAGRADWDED